MAPPSGTYSVGKGFTNYTEALIKWDKNLTRNCRNSIERVLLSGLKNRVDIRFYFSSD